MIKKLRTLSSWKRIALLSIVFGILILGVLAYTHLVFAWVDRTPLNRIELYKRLEEKYGKNVKEEMIAEVLLRSESAKRGVVVSDGEVDFRISQIAQAQGGEEKLKELLRLQNLSIDVVKRQIKSQLIIERLFDKKATVSAQAVEDYIDENKEQLPKITDETSSEAANLRRDVENQLKRQKISKLFNEWLRQALRKINL